jgi:hypothetical protein
MNMTELIARTKQQMEAITGLSPETVSRLDRAEDGWSVGIDMLEHRSIPRTYDLLASFDVSLDQDGNIQNWHRTGRFVRCQQTEG